MADILVIDDEKQIRTLVRRALAKLGHTVHEAASGKEGLDLFRRIEPTLVITDIVMPDGEGIETIRLMRELAPTTPILAISGGTAPALYLRAATTLGASAALEKPFRLERLTAVVTDLLTAALARC